MKWDNCVLFAGPGARRSKRLALVDWEIAGKGDPCWDVATIFADYLSCWLFSIPVASETPPEQAIARARYPLEGMHPALRSFWRTYARRMQVGAAGASDWLLRAARYSGARLIHSALEQMQVAARLTGQTISMLQLSLNILQRPQEAVIDLLGLPLWL
jgi:thiamine kinase-like enzyme